MANLQQCLLHDSLQHRAQKRRHRKRHKGKKLIGALNNSIIQQCYWQSVSERSNEAKFFKPHDKEERAFNQTIDLCNDDSNETRNCSVNVPNNSNNPCAVSQKEVNVIDISGDSPDENEVMEVPVNQSNLPANKSPTNTPHSSLHDSKPAEKSSINSFHSSLHDRKSTDKSPITSLHSSLPEIQPKRKLPESSSCSSKSPERIPIKRKHDSSPGDSSVHGRKCLDSPVERKLPERRPPKATKHNSSSSDSSVHGRKCPDSRSEQKLPDSKSQEGKLPASTPEKDIETVLIDISGDGNESDKSSQKNDTNDDILVVGTFSKTSKPNTKQSAKPKKQGACRNNKHQAALNYIALLNENPKVYITKLRRRIKAKYFKKLLQYKKKCEVDLFDTIKYQHLLLDNSLVGSQEASGIGGNVYINTPVSLPSKGLRPIIIDGSNVAFTPSNGFKFSCKRLDICIRYFKEKGHRVTAFVPQYRLQTNQSDDPRLLNELVQNGDVILTPSKMIDGKLVVPYDDRFIVQTAVLKGGVIISRDNYRDLLEENPSWAETIKYRTLAFTWVDDVLMFPNDPLGGIGPTLEEFLQFH